MVRLPNCSAESPAVQRFGSLISDPARSRCTFRDFASATIRELLTLTAWEGLTAAEIGVGRPAGLPTRSACTCTGRVLGADGNYG